MNQKIIAAVIGIVVAIGAVIVFSGSSNEKEIVQNNTATQEENKEITETETETEKETNENTVNKTNGSYEAYSPEKVAAKAEQGNVILFFRASWCPTCRTLDKDIKANLGNIPSGVTILDVDYDNSEELQDKYGVTYQHTLVQVDKDGNLIKKWSGSPTLLSLVAQIKK